MVPLPLMVASVSQPDSPATEPATTYLAAALCALVREEMLARRPRRLVEARHATWQRFRGRLQLRDLVELVIEDAAVNQPEPFDAARVLGDAATSIRSVPEAVMVQWIAELTSRPVDASERDYVEAQAKRLGLNARPAFSELPKLAPHHRVLEIPGSGGRLAGHAVLSDPTLSMKDMFTIACASWQERMLAGLVAVSLDVRGEVRISVDPTLARARLADGGFSHVLGLKPEKGGAFDAHTLEGIFPSAAITLV